MAELVDHLQGEARAQFLAGCQASDRNSYLFARALVGRGFEAPEIRVLQNAVNNEIRKRRDSPG